MAKRIEELEQQMTAADQLLVANDGLKENNGASSFSSGQHDSTARTGPSRSQDIDAVDALTGISPLGHTTASLQEIVTPQESVRAAVKGDRMQPMNDQQIAQWEAAAIGSAATVLHLPEAQVAHLLRMHWTWVHPVYLFVPRTVFLRDLASNGPYASVFLLSVLCLHSTRFTNSGLSADLEALVRMSLGKELYSKPSTVTVQALLQLSAREVGRGEASLAWSFSGLAFRMAVDIGIFTRRTDPSDGTLHDRVTAQLAWSCYAWDKAISLYLGRVPALQDPPNFEPMVVDEAAEQSPWSPYPTTANSPATQQTYHLSTAFVNLCKLKLIVNDILIRIYGPKPSTRQAAVLLELGQRLRQWRQDSPTALQMEEACTDCPAPHVVTQNLLYYTAAILLHRPFVKAEPCRSICRDAARNIVSIFRLFDETFGMSSVTYMMAYCAYVGATVALLGLSEDIPGSQQSLNMCLKVLHNTRASCPGIQAGIDIIVNGLATKPTGTHTEAERTNRGCNTITHITSIANDSFSTSNATSANIVPDSSYMSTSQSWPNSFPAFPFETACSSELANDMTSHMPYMGSLDPFANEWTDFDYSTLENDVPINLA